MSSQAHSGKKNKAPPAKWTEELVRIFVASLEDECRITGQLTDNGFKVSQWTSICLRFNEASGCNFDKQQLHNKYADLKRDYKQIIQSHQRKQWFRLE